MLFALFARRMQLIMHEAQARIGVFPSKRAKRTLWGKLPFEESELSEATINKRILKLIMKQKSVFRLFSAFLVCQSTSGKQVRYSHVNIPTARHMLSTLCRVTFPARKKNPRREQVNIPSWVCHCTQSAADFQAINIKNDISLVFRLSEWKEVTSNI